MSDCSLGPSLLELRRRLAWEKKPLGEFFHASEDRQEIRDAVFGEITKHDFKVQATIMEKCKAMPHVKASRPKFFKYGWYFHFKYGMPPVISATDETLVTAASLGTKKEKLSFTNAIDDVMRQTRLAKDWRLDFLPARTDPCLQVVDYCAWAIQKKWETKGKETRSYDLIKDRITYEFELWKHGQTVYY